jgi:hypothetical protein
VTEPDVQRLLVELDRLHVYRGQRSPAELKTPAPHKPLLLLVAFRRTIVEGGERLLAFSAVEEEVVDLLQVYGHGKSVHPEYPFARLSTSPWLWETTIPPTALALTADPSASYLREHHVRGGLTEAALASLRHGDTLGTATRRMLAKYFSDLDAQQRWDLLVRVGLSEAALA